MKSDGIFEACQNVEWVLESLLETIESSSNRERTEGGSARDDILGKLCDGASSNCKTRLGEVRNADACDGCLKTSYQLRTASVDSDVGGQTHANVSSSENTKSSGAKRN